MKTQELTVGPNEQMSLATLRKKYRDCGFVGLCVVKFDPAHLAEVKNIPNFVLVQQYSALSQEHPHEVGTVEVFRMVQSST